LIRQHLRTRPYFFPSSKVKKKLSHFQRYMIKHTPPSKLLFKLFHLYLKILIKFQSTNRISVAILKDIINFYVFFKWDQLRTTSLIQLEKRNRYFKNRSTYFWNVQEKQGIWKQLQYYAQINKITQKQWRTPSFRPKHKFWIHTNYFWMILQQWHNDLKWSGHKYLLDKMIIDKSNSYESIIRQRIGPKWKSRIKCYINSRSYRYIPRNDYLIEQEKEKTREWIYNLINITSNSKPINRFGQQVELKKHYLKKQQFYRKHNKKKETKHQKTRQAWYKH